MTHHSALGPLHTGFLQSADAGGIGKAGNSDIAPNVNALSAELTKSDLVNVSGAVGAISQNSSQVGLTTPDHTQGTGTVLNPDQKPDQNPLLPPHHH